MLYLCTSLHYQELYEAENPDDAKTFMIRDHPSDGEYSCYAATDDDVRLFSQASIIPLTPRRRVKLEQLDWMVNGGMNAAHERNPAQ